MARDTIGQSSSRYLMERLTGMSVPRCQCTVLYEDNHLLAIAKPAMLPTMGVSAGKLSLLSWAKDYIRCKYRKPGNVYLGIVSRLDAPVSGVILVAKTSKAAARLSELFRSRSVQKLYWAVVENRIHPPSGRLVHYLVKDERHRRMHISLPGRAGSVAASLSYRTLKILDHCALLEIDLETGRKHQIRVQLAHRGQPILGDRKYGSRRPFPAGIALHCRSLQFEHPVQHKPVEIVAPLPASWSFLGMNSTSG